MVLENNMHFSSRLSYNITTIIADHSDVISFNSYILFAYLWTLLLRLSNFELISQSLDLDIFC